MKHSITQMVNPCKTVGAINATGPGTAKSSLQNFPTFGDKIEMQEPLRVFEKLCDFPVLYFNLHVEKKEDQNTENLVVTLSDKEPTVDENLIATYPLNSIKVDIAVVRISESSLCNLDFWGNMLCSVLTFRGHEVFYNGKLYNPFIR